MLQRSDPFKESKCNNTKCLVCSTGGKGSCRSTGVTYELVCQICRHKYIGETSRSAYTRGKEHREEGSVVWRHCCDVHAGNIAGFTMNVTRTFHWNDAMLRQITESVRINQTEEGQRKKSGRISVIPKAVVTKSWNSSYKHFFVFSIETEHRTLFSYILHFVLSYCCVYYYSPCYFRVCQQLFLYFDL